MLSQGQEPVPKLAGVVTDVGTPEDFHVNGVEVLCTPATMVSLVAGSLGGESGCSPHVLGQGIKAYGERQKHTHAIEATRLEIAPRIARKLEGVAVIDQAPVEASGTWTVRADGYRILVTPATRCLFTAPLKSMADVSTNVWVRYTGKQRSDGAVLAETAELTANGVKAREDKLQSKNEFDPATPTEKDRQGGWSKTFRGLDPKRIPAYPDAAMQARVDALGARLIPAYQRALPDSDPTKMHFRFQVVDQPKVHDALTLPNGIILVPYQVIARLGRDTQLATVLADNIAGALEKQTLRQIPAGQKMGAAQIAGYAGGVFVPGLGIATGAANMAVAAKLLRQAEEQSGRVSLDLLSDAGFNVAEAPVTWWLLASLKPKNVEDIAMPHRAEYLYEVLASTWPCGAATCALHEPVSSR